MEIKDKKIAHLRSLGCTKESAIRTLERELKRGSDFLEIAEMTDVIEHRDGGIPNKRVAYVAGIYGSRNARNEFDLGKNAYGLVYFNVMVRENNLWEHGTINDIGILELTDYVPLKSINSRQS